MPGQSVVLASSGATAAPEGPDVRQLPRVPTVLEATGIRQVHCLSPRPPLPRSPPTFRLPRRVEQPGGRVARAQDTVLPLDVLSEPAARAAGAGRGGGAAAGGEWAGGDGGRGTESVRDVVQASG